MQIRPIDQTEYTQLAELYKAFFPTHNIFQGTIAQIISYLESQEHKIIVAVTEETIVAGTLLVNFGANAERTHLLWKLRHFAFNSEEIAVQLLAQAEAHIHAASQTAKIELTIAETEQGIAFYKSQGYMTEGTLRNHYRWGETCYILGKSLPQ